MRIERLIHCSLAALLSVAATPPPTATTALVDAVKNQDAESVRALLKQHVDVNAPEADGTTALHWAAHWGDLETVDALLREGANAPRSTVTAPRRCRKPCASAAAPLIEKLLKAGADPNTFTTAQAETVLMKASREGNRKR
jgi:ankyrin repeat protein